MHFEILVEDLSGKKALDILIPRIIDMNAGHTFRVHSYKGSGHIPRDLQSVSDPSKRILLERLPKLIQGYDKTFSSYSDNYAAVLIVVCDLDNRCFREFRQELSNCLEKSAIQSQIYFCIAIEEGEAWYLGDINAIKIAYPQAKSAILDSYINDSICGTWEKLADAIYRGGAKQLSKLGGASVGQEKTVWAENISPQMNVDINRSPSFGYFRDKLRHLSQEESTTLVQPFS